MRLNIHKNASEQIFENAKALRKKSTDAERILWNKLRNRKFLGVKFRRQHPIESFVLDFFTCELNLAIEIDGKYHNSKEQRENDEGRTYEIEKHNISVIRFSNEEIINDIKKVEKILNEKIVKHSLTLHA